MQIEEGKGNGVNIEKPQLVLTVRAKGLPLVYKCSQCGQEFLLPEDRTPKEGMAELWAAFKEHVHEEHREAVMGTEGSGTT